MAAGLPEELQGLSQSEIIELLCRTNPGVWAERKRGFKNAPFHWEWYEQVVHGRRVCIVAPREHAKTEVLTINATAWRSVYQPGTWTYLFSGTRDQSVGLKSRIDEALRESHPEMLEGMKVFNTTESVYSNGSRITVAGAGKSVRSAHPDVIIGDDVLEESSTLTKEQMDRTKRWWLGSVANMAHPGTVRTLPNGVKVSMPPTRIFLVGTPFHQSDLLLSMRTNEVYTFRRYSAEFDPDKLVDGYAVEVG